MMLHINFLRKYLGQIHEMSPPNKPVSINPIQNLIYLNMMTLQEYKSLFIVFSIKVAILISFLLLLGFNYLQLHCKQAYKLQICLIHFKSQFFECILCVLKHSDLTFTRAIRQMLYISMNRKKTNGGPFGEDHMHYSTWFFLRTLRKK